MSPIATEALAGETVKLTSVGGVGVGAGEVMTPVPPEVVTGVAGTGMDPESVPLETAVAVC